jgi:hypothetical protein
METKTETLAQKALRLISSVPQDEFMPYDFTNGENKCCVVGHYMRLTSNNPTDYSKQNCDDWLIKESFGCSEFKLSDIKQIVVAYQKLKK